MGYSILILGGGNMGGAMARALNAKSEYSVSVVEQDAAKREALSGVGITTHATLNDAAHSDVLVLAIKPQQFGEMSGALSQHAGTHKPLLLSVMAGIPLSALTTISPRAVRAMPNLPAVINESMSVLCAPSLDSGSRALAEMIFTSIGEVAWVEEEAQLHAVTAVSGSGPAYVFALMEAMQAAAIAQGLPASLAKELVAQTVKGAAMLADDETVEPGELRAAVTSKGGTTEAALAVLNSADFTSLVARMIAAASARSKELSA